MNTLQVDLTADIESAVQDLIASLERVGDVHASGVAAIITSPLSGASYVVLRYSADFATVPAEFDDFDQFEPAGSLTDLWIDSDVDLVEVRVGEDDVRLIEVSDEALAGPYLDFLASLFANSAVRTLCLDLVRADEAVLTLFFDYDGEPRRQLMLTRTP